MFVQRIFKVTAVRFPTSGAWSRFLAEGAQDRVAIYETLKAYLPLDLDLDSDRCQSKTHWLQCYKVSLDRIPGFFACFANFVLLVNSSVISVTLNNLLAPSGF